MTSDRDSRPHVAMRPWPGQSSAELPAAEPASDASRVGPALGNLARQPHTGEEWHRVLLQESDLGHTQYVLCGKFREGFDPTNPLPRREGSIRGEFHQFSADLRPYNGPVQPTLSTVLVQETARLAREEGTATLFINPADASQSRWLFRYFMTTPTSSNGDSAPSPMTLIFSLPDARVDTFVQTVRGNPDVLEDLVQTSNFSHILGAGRVSERLCAQKLRIILSVNTDNHLRTTNAMLAPINAAEKDSNNTVIFNQPVGEQQVTP